LVICDVFLTDLMRRRMSRVEGMSDRIQVAVVKDHLQLSPLQAKFASFTENRPMLTMGIISKSS
jgi:hypothetical protein